MKHDEIEHIRSFGGFLKDNWDVVTGITITLWYMLVRVKRIVLKDYATTQLVSEKTERIFERIEESERRNTEQHDHIMQTILDHLDRR